MNRLGAAGFCRAALPALRAAKAASIVNVSSCCAVSAEEIACPVLWLASDEAAFITGTTLMADGGLHIM